MWAKLSRKMETRHGCEYLEPGWQGGGLFMQFINGIWLDERGTVMGRSAREFARAQIEHARRNTYPAWGWSASNEPTGGYLGWGALVDNVVTPHASVLAIQFFPDEVLANLHALEGLGARPGDEGFVDAVDIKTREIADIYLVLDQSMLFLSLVNALCDDSIRHRFQADARAQIGRELIPDFRDLAK